MGVLSRLTDEDKPSCVSQMRMGFLQGGATYASKSICLQLISKFTQKLANNAAKHTAITR